MAPGPRLPVWFSLARQKYELGRLWRTSNAIWYQGQGTTFRGSIATPLLSRWTFSARCSRARMTGWGGQAAPGGRRRRRNSRPGEGADVETGAGERVHAAMVGDALAGIDH